MLSLIHNINQPSDSWRWAYAIGSVYSAIVLFLIAFFMEETYVLKCGSRVIALTLLNQYVRSSPCIEATANFYGTAISD